MPHNHDHCHAPVDDSTPLGRRQARVLKTVLAINAAMVVIEGVSGYLAHSSSMVADTLDMFGDALGAGSSLVARKRSKRWQAGTALAKAGLMGVLGLGVLAGAALSLFSPVMPIAATMGIVGGLAFAANAACVAMLYPHRNDGINMKSTLICTRNDMISNVAVLAAAGASHLLASPLPDIVVGVGVAGLFVKSSAGIARDAFAMLRAPEEKAHDAHDCGHVHAAPAGPGPKRTFSLKTMLRAVFNLKSSAAAQAPEAAHAHDHDGHDHSKHDHGKRGPGA